MSKKHGLSRLGIQLILAAVASFAVGALVFILFTAVSYRGLNAVIMSPANLAAQEAACADRLQQYITSRDIGLSDMGRLDEWAEKENNALVTIYHEKEPVYYNSEILIGLPQMQQDTEWKEDADSQGNTGWQEENGEATGYQIHLRDSTVYAVLSCFPDTRYYLLSDLAGMILAVGAALAVLYACIRKKVRYIALLESELQILKGGDLTYPISVRGKDELASLAEEMDAMRLAILERQQAKEQAVKANRELVTAMSHDLRTPLTSLLGYVEILNLHKYQGEEQERYIHAIREKVYQIKRMSDKLFEYFLVFRREKEDLEFQKVNGIEFLGQVVEESLFDMENEGFEIERTSDEIDCTLMMDVEAVRRVFGNLFSNMIKYADRSQPVMVRYEQRDGRLSVCFINKMAAGVRTGESSHIGLRTCEKIMDDHGGQFRYREQDGQFEAEVVFCTVMSCTKGE